MVSECISYERRREDMAKDKEKKQNKQTDTFEVLEEIKKINEKLESKQDAPTGILKDQYLRPIIVGILLLIAGFVWDLHGDMKVVSGDIQDLKDMGIERRLTTLEFYHNITADGEVIQSVMVAFNGDALPFIGSVNDTTNEMTEPTWEDTDIIATDVNTGLQYTAENLANKLILTSYVVDGQEVFFHGQFNENNNWNGNCVINVYKNNELTLIMDAVYDNGELLSYQQVLKTSTGDGNIWVISKRTHKDGVNTGETWNYVRDYTHPKVFETKDVKEENIISVEAFQTNINTRLISYYNGNTADGTYNDKSGNAYLVKFNEDGTVKLLYAGNFVNGYCNDTTGNAFSIAYSEEYNAYFHNTGNFKNGKAAHLSTDPLTIDEVKDIIKDMSFNCELTWKE